MMVVRKAGNAQVGAGGAVTCRSVVTPPLRGLHWLSPQCALPAEQSAHRSAVHGMQVE